MAPMFASSDIAALVAAYQPPLPTKDQSSLIRTHSKMELIQSRKVLTRLRTLLDTEPRRIELSSLPLRLDIERSDWILGCYDGPVYFSRDRQSVLPNPYIATILDDFNTRIRDGFLDLAEFALTQDISLQSLNDLINSAAPQSTADQLRRFDVNGRIYVAHQDVVHKIQGQVLDGITGTKAEKLNLSNLLPDVPHAILLQLYEGIVEQRDGVKGSMQVEAGSVVFTPISYISAQELRNRAEHEKKIAGLLQTLGKDGYCIIDDPFGSAIIGGEVLLSEVCDAYSSDHPGENIESFPISDSPERVLALEGAVQQSMQQLSAAIEQLVGAGEAESSSRSALDKAQEAILLKTLPHPILASGILNDIKHRQTLEAAYRTDLDRAAANEAAEFSKLYQEKLAAPLELYALGQAQVQDPALKAHMEEYTREFATRELLGPFTALARERGLLRDKARGRDTEKCRRACADAKTFGDVQSAVHRLGKKLKIEAPGPELLTRVHSATLQQQSRAVAKMTRGSDVLQNLVWILLAKRLPGLFISSGKDTSRMIKEYERVGDREVAMQLQRWRDQLKVGAVGSEELALMRDMASTAVRETLV